MKRQSQRAGCRGHLGKLSFMNFIARIGEVTYARKTRDRLLQQLQALGHEFPIDRSEPSEVPAGSSQTLDQSDRNRFTHLGEDDGKSGARPLHGKGCWRVDGKYELEWQARQFGREGIERGLFVARPSVLGRDVLFFDPPMIS